METERHVDPLFLSLFLRFPTLAVSIGQASAQTEVMHDVHSPHYCRHDGGLGLHRIRPARAHSRMTLSGPRELRVRTVYVQRA